MNDPKSKRVKALVMIEQIMAMLNEIPPEDTPEEIPVERYNAVQTDLRTWRAKLQISANEGRARRRDAGVKRNAE